MPKFTMGEACDFAADYLNSLDILFRWDDVGCMGNNRDNKAVMGDLLKMLGGVFPGISVEIAHAARWNRDCVTFRWDGFAGLLPEERFHRLVKVIPEAFREQNLAGLVWLELGPAESVEEFLRLPRSEDVARKERTIYAGLRKANFFGLLNTALGSSPDKKCAGDFAECERILPALKLGPHGSQDAKLIFIRHHAFCDCQVLLTAQQALADAHAGAA